MLQVWYCHVDLQWNLQTPSEPNYYRLGYTVYISYPVHVTGSVACTCVECIIVLKSILQSLQVFTDEYVLKVCPRKRRRLHGDRYPPFPISVSRHTLSLLARLTHSLLP